VKLVEPPAFTTSVVFTVNVNDNIGELSAVVPLQPVPVNVTFSV
jgi:hypothetical protein